MEVKAAYPKFKDKDKYILAKTYSYYSKADTSPLSWEQLKYAVQEVTDYVQGLIDHRPYTTESVIELMRMFLSPTYQGENIRKGTSQAFLVGCIKRNKPYLTIRFKKVLPTDETQIEEYLDFISEMAKQVITEICDETAKYILEEEAKAKTPQFEGKVGEKPRNFRERMRPRPAEEEPDLTTSSSGEESQPKAKRVRFADPIER